MSLSLVVLVSFTRMRLHCFCAKATKHAILTTGTAGRDRPEGQNDDECQRWALGSQPGMFAAF